MFTGYRKLRQENRWFQAAYIGILVELKHIGENPTEYPQKELKLSGAAVELEQKGQWKVIHHFLWNEDPGFHGTESLQIYQVYSGQNSGWIIKEGLAGQVLYDKNGTSYAADYAVLQNETYSTRDGFPFYDMMENSSVSAEATYSCFWRVKRSKILLQASLRRTSDLLTMVS